VAFWPAAPSACGGTVQLWNAAPRPVGAPVPTGSVLGTGGVAFSPNGKPLAIACGDGTVRLWNPVTGHRTGSIGDVHGVVGAGPVDPS
jgi:WD40 repeat protein